MATKTKRPKKAKLRGGTNRPPESIPMPSADLATTAADEAAPAVETNGHLAEPVEEVLATAAAKALDAAGFKVEHPSLDPAKAYDSPERLAEWDAKSMKLVNASAKECGELKADHEAKAEVAKEAKKKYELAVADHFKLVADRKAGRGKPVQQELFDRTRGHAAAEPDLREPSEVPAPGDDSWKVVPLAELVEKDGLPAKVAQFLGDAGINTLGELAAYTEPKASGWTDKLTDLPGIGPKKAEEIDAATAAFWARYKPHATDDTTGPGAEAGGDGGGSADAGDGPGDRGAGGDQPEHAGRGEGDRALPAEPSAEPAGYHTDASAGIGKRMKAGRRGKKK